MMRWIRAMLDRSCRGCGGWKPLWTHYCDTCWPHHDV